MIDDYRMLIFGGIPKGKVKDICRILDLKDMEWTDPSEEAWRNLPTNRCDASLVCYANTLCLFGGEVEYFDKQENEYKGIFSNDYYHDRSVIQHSKKIKGPKHKKRKTKHVETQNDEEMKISKIGEIPHGYVVRAE